MSKIDDCIYFSSNRFARDMESIANQAFKPTGLAPVYSYILLALDEEKHLAIKNLASIMHYAPSSMSRFINRMEKDGLVEKKYNTKEINVYITDKGQSMIPKILECYNQTLQKVTQLIGDQQRQEIVVLLNSASDKVQFIR